MLFYNAFTWGLVVDKFYSWFVEDVFSLPAITYYQAIGISMFLGLFKNHSTRLVREEYLEDKYQRYSLIVLAPWFFLLGGWVINLIIK